MIDVVVPLIPALLWLAYRALYILMSPVDELVEEMSIDVPDCPAVSIDQVSATLAVLRWDSPSNCYDEVKFAIIVNGHVVSTISSSSCKLTRLIPNQKYMVSVRACSPITQFHSYSRPICIQTVSDDDSSYLAWVRASDSAPRQLSPGLHKTLSLHNSNNDSPAQSSADIFSLTPAKIAAISDMFLLHKYAAELRAATLTVNTEMAAHDTTTNETCAQLARTIAERKAEYDQEHDSKTKSDMSVKALERTKDKLTYQKSKLVSQLNALKASLDLSHQKLNEREEELKKIEHRSVSLLENEDKERSKILNEISSISEKATAIKDTVHTLDEKFKAVLAEKRRTAQQLLDLRPLVAAFFGTGQPATGQPAAALTTGPLQASVARSRSNSGAVAPGDDLFSKDGAIHARVLNALNDILEVVPSWREEVLADAEACQAAESEWRDAFRTAIKRYVSIYAQVEVAKAKIDRNYEPSKVSEYQASIEYGGIANALPKRSLKSLTRNFSPPTSLKEKSAPPPYLSTNAFGGYTEVYGTEQAAISKVPESGRGALHAEHAVFSGNPELAEQVQAFPTSMLATPEPSVHLFAGNYETHGVHGYGDFGGAVPQAGYSHDDASGPALLAGYQYTDMTSSVSQPVFPLGSPLPQANYPYDAASARPQSGFPYDDSAYNLTLPVEAHNPMLGNDYCTPAYAYPSAAAASSILLAPSVSSPSMTGQFGQTLSMPDLHEPFGLGRQLLASPPSAGTNQPHASTGGRTFAKLLHSGAGSWMSHKFGLSTTPPSKGPSPLWTGDDDGDGLARSSSLRMHNDPMSLSSHARSVSLNSHIWRSSDDSAPTHHFDLGAVSGMMGQDEFSPFPSRKSWEP